MLENNEINLELIDKRRFANAIREAIGHLDQAAGCYRLYEKSYYLETKHFLEKQALSLEGKSISGHSNCI